MSRTNVTMTQDTQIGGSSGKFPATRWSAVRAACGDDPADRNRALEAIIAAYWKPIYKYLRIRWSKSNEDAKDLTQAFFTRLIEKEYLGDFDPSKARLRTFLRVCVDHFVANEAKSANRLKRGGSAQHVSLDFEAAEAELARTTSPLQPSSPPERIDEFLEKEYLRSLFSAAVENLRQFCESRGKQIHFRVFETYDLDDGESHRPTYAQLAAEHGIAVTDVTNYLAFARREFRRISLERLREMTASDEEFRREARALLGVEPE
jgi:RNA polymerase sigma factor (sigma-70 family)